SASEISFHIVRSRRSRCATSLGWRAPPRDFRALPTTGHIPATRPHSGCATAFSLLPRRPALATLEALARLEMMMEDGIQTFFDGYARVFNQALAGDIGMAEVSSMYAAEFIAATPLGVKAGTNGEQLREAMKMGYARYRE